MRLLLARFMRWQAKLQMASAQRLLCHAQVLDPQVTWPRVVTIIYKGNPEIPLEDDPEAIRRVL